MKLKNKKGFTLIELLAVIVVLAIIALIATPIVMNTIKNAKKGSAERGADNYIKQVETAIATSKLDGKDVADGTYQIDQDGNLTGTGLPDGKLTIEMNGEKPKSGSIVIKNGQVTTDSTMEIGDYTVSYNPTNKKYEANQLYKGILCQAVTTATTGNVPQGKFAYGDEYTCELGDNDTKTFFVLETSDNNVSLIMNANVDSNGKAITSTEPKELGNVIWLSKEDYMAAGGEDLSMDDRCKRGGLCATNEYGPITAEKSLKAKIKGWTKLVSSKVTLPTYDQIYKAAGNKELELPTWLYSNLKEIPILYGYWTSTPYDIYGAWCVDSYESSLNYASSYTTVWVGIRPVITISKSQLN